MANKKSLGVTGIGWFNIVLGSIFLCLNLIEFLVVSNRAGFQKIFRSPAIVLGSFWLLMWTSVIITGLGVLRLQEKARANTVYLAGILFVSNIFFNPKAFSPFYFLIGIVYPIIAIIFLMSPKVKRQFDRNCTFVEEERLLLKKAKEERRYKCCQVVTMLSIVLMIVGIVLHILYYTNLGEVILYGGLVMLILVIPLAIFSAISYAIKDIKHNKSTSKVKE